jgi:putative ABC transport system ATP-binding protein
LRVLRDVDLSIRCGEFRRAVGASARAVDDDEHPRLSRPATSARHALDGADVSKLDDDHLSRVRNRSIGFVFQSFQRFRS